MVSSLKRPQSVSRPQEEAQPLPVVDNSQRDDIRNEIDEMRRAILAAERRSQRHWEKLERNAKKEKLLEDTNQDTQNAEVEPPGFQPLSFVEPKTTFENNTEHFAKLGTTEQNRPAIADIATQLVELDRSDPEAAQSMLATMKAVLETGAAKPEAGEFAQRVSRSRASAAPDEAQAPGQGDMPPPPTEAPAKYAARPIDPKTGRQEGVDKFLPRVYAPWIVPDPEGGPRPVLTLPRKLIEQLDPDCDRAITAWPGNHRGQDFPVKIARKNAAEPPTAEQKREAHRVMKWLERERARQREAASDSTPHQS